MATKADCSILRAVTKDHFTSHRQNNKEPLIAITVLEVTNLIAGSSHMTEVTIGKFTSFEAQMIVVIATVMGGGKIEGGVRGGGEGGDRTPHINTQLTETEDLVLVEETQTHSTRDPRVMPLQDHQ